MYRVTQQVQSSAVEQDGAGEEVYSADDERIAQFLAYSSPYFFWGLVGLICGAVVLLG